MRQLRAPRLLGVAALGILLLTGCQQGALDPTPGATDPGASDPAAEPSASATPTPTPEPVTVAVSAMGDILPHDSVTADALQPDGTYEYGHFWDAARPIWADSDLVYCNQEAPSGGVEMGLTYFPAFNAPVEFAEGIADAGCNTIGLGNNHTFDRGQEGIDRTREVWDGLDPLLIHGAFRSEAEQAEVPTTVIAGDDGTALTVAFLNFVDLSNTPTGDHAVTWLDDPLVETQLAEAEESADATIVAVHWGDEYSGTVNERQREQAQRLAELGADVILGTHPHVLQEAEWLTREDGSRAFVYYSLGNSVTTQMAIPRVVSAVAQFELVGLPGGEIEVVDPAAVPIYMHFDLTPAQFANGQWVNRRNLQLHPLVDAAEPITRSAWRNELTVESGMQLVTDALGPDVRIVTDSFED
ncbi:poly-gamma-glutamate synthesis protein (capsule biosynthesis protein) [Agrococcus baldri]|uniref:Poly-gamma-glutamate synthesis protein (Capsule biosynthesis protein) n=1 Tax=Agrococcus baldri TaxID=153730 RepID=A0AA94HLJ2_9MICO|nr:CapA family protein [Agrococcus baldri]SFS07892.1 poly-gamma-glutamate synthesis protein (capsule biosynthesis protein) [Agrococcus baldri]